MTVRVSLALAADGAEVVVLRDGADGARYASLLPPGVAPIDAAGLVREIDAAARIECVLALADNDLDNLRVAAEVRKRADHIPVVVRSFDPALADQLEQGLGIRRAYSVPALSAPAFVTAALGHTVLEILRLGDGEVPIVELEALPGSACVGLTVAEVKQKCRCAVLARRSPGGPWIIAKAGEPGAPLAPGERVAVGGLLLDVLRLGVDNSPLRLGRRSSGHGTRMRAVRRRRSVNLLPQIAAGLLSLLFVSVFVFAANLHLRPVDAVYFVITTATTTGYGDISLRDAPDWLKMFGGVVMLSGGALLGILFSQLAASATADRLDEVMGRRARRLRGHVVVAGLGNLGFRVVRLLTDLRVPVAIVERNASGEFVENVRERAPVVIGDARLTDDLARVGIDGAAAVIACTDDDLTNIQMCLHARRLAPAATTVARVFEDALADQLSGALAIDRALSASAAASSAFIGAATDDRAFRSLSIGGHPYLAFRYTAAGRVASETVESWRSRGIRVLALRMGSGAVLPPPSAMPELEAGDEMILCGPRDEVLAMAGDPAPS